MIVEIRMRLCATLRLSEYAHASGVGSSKSRQRDEVGHQIDLKPYKLQVASYRFSSQRSCPVMPVNFHSRNGCLSLTPSPGATDVGVSRGRWRASREGDSNHVRAKDNLATADPRAKTRDMVKARGGSSSEQPAGRERSYQIFYLVSPPYVDVIDVDGSAAGVAGRVIRVILAGISCHHFEFVRVFARGAVATCTHEEFIWWR